MRDTTMHILKTLSGNLALLFAAALFVASSSVFAETGVSDDSSSHNVHDSLGGPGVYLGFLPCEDCKGIKTTLALNKNGTYIFITQYIGKSEREFVEKGRYAWNENNNNIIDLTPRKGGAVQHYLVEQDALTKLDENSEIIGGQNANRYVLKRKEVTGSSEQHGASH